MAWIDTAGKIRFENTDFMYGKFGDINGIDNARYDNRVANVSSDDGMEGQLDSMFVRAKKYNKPIEIKLTLSGKGKLFSKCKDSHEYWSRYSGEYAKGQRDAWEKVLAWVETEL